jgi:fatty-acyl-CoA synthase
VGNALTFDFSHTNWPSLSVRQELLRQSYPVWQPMTLDDLLEKNAQEFPGRPFVITHNQSWTYAEMHSWVKRLAAGLINSGVKPGDHVAMLMANFPEFIAIKFAIAMVGAVAVPINFFE